MKMGRTYAYFISLLALLLLLKGNLQAQDTISFPLKIRVGAEIIGPIKYFTDKNVLNLEGYASVDITEKKSVLLAAGYLDYKYSQYNYNYLNSGYFIRGGMGFNLMNGKKSEGKYWSGIELSLGLSHFNSETPFLKQDNYWGSVSSAIPPAKNRGLYIEAAPGFKAEIFKNFTMGWAVSSRLLLHTNTSKDLRPIYFPGFGNGTKSFTTSFKYYLIWNIPYKRIRVIIKKPPPEEEEEPSNDQNQQQDNTQNSSGKFQQQGGNIRQ
jgi:hypothetical protein